MFFDLGVGDELFTSDGVISNSILPVGSELVIVSTGGFSVNAIQLPDSFTSSCSMDVNAACPTLFIANDTLDILEYEIQGEYIHTYIFTCS